MTHSLRASVRALAVVPVLLLGAACARGDDAPAGDAPPAGAPAAPAAARADDGPLTSADVRAHDLTMDEIRRWMAGMGAMLRAAQADPAVAEALASESEDTPQQTVDRIRSRPELVDALRAEGLTPRQYTVIGLAYMQASLAVALTEGRPDAQLPPEVNERNVRLVRDNRAELERMGESLRAENPQLGAEPDDDSD